MRSNFDVITYHRKPTQSEIRFGYGATHYRDFTKLEATNTKTGKLKIWLKAEDGLRYYR